MIQVYSAEHPTEAHMVKGILEAQGIACMVQGETLFSSRGELPVTPETAPSVWIIEEGRYKEARLIVWQYEKSRRERSSIKETWSCLSCGEELEVQFTHCWKCGMPRHIPPLQK